VGAIDISKILRLSMPSMNMSSLLSFTGSFGSKLVRISVDMDICTSIRIVMVASSHDSRDGLISEFAKIHEKRSIPRWTEDRRNQGLTIG
jgi:hypothetical protein